jgi:import inner membrane translocase subunit TIM23
MSFTSFLNDRQTPGAAQPQTANQLFGSATFQTQPTPSPSTGSSEFAPDAPAGITTASDLFNASAYDPAKLHPLAGLGDNLDYLLLDEAKLQELPGGQSALPSRGWSDELSYGTGTTYLSGESIRR